MFYWKHVSTLVVTAGEKKYEHLTFVANAALTLSHVNAAPERGFSVNNVLMTKDRESLSQRSIVAQRVVKEAIWLFGSCTNVPVTKDLLHAVKRAHSEYAVFLVMCSGVTLCAWHSTSVPVWQPAADIRDRRSSISLLCWDHDTTSAVDSSSYPRRPRLFGGCSACMEQSATRDSGLLLTFDIPEGDQVSPFCQSYGWRGAVYFDGQQISALSCATV